jgi:hypothetical protein
VIVEKLLFYFVVNFSTLIFCHQAGKMDGSVMMELLWRVLFFFSGTDRQTEKNR